MSQTGLPFDDIRALARMLPPADSEAIASVRRRNATLAKPVGSLGQLEGLAEWLAGWQGNARPAVTRPLLAIFSGTHGLCRDTEDTTVEIVANLAAGGGAANQICAVMDVGLKVFELALQVPTHDIRHRPALDERDCVATIAFGMEAIAGGADVIGIGTLGQGGGIASAAILTALFGRTSADWLVDPSSAASIRAAEAALAHHTGQLSDPLEILRRLGGRECSAAMGAILAARLQRIPVLLSGIVSLTAAAVLRALDVTAIDHCMAAHTASAPAHAALLRQLGLSPILTTEFALEDGAGAALAIGHLRAAAACINEMATAQAPLLN